MVMQEMMEREIGKVKRAKKELERRRGRTGGGSGLYRIERGGTKCRGRSAARAVR
jgi:hypothetical protein